MEEKVLAAAYALWMRYYKFRDVDEEIKPFLAIPFLRDDGSWLRRVREALFLSTGGMAEKLKISRSAYTRLEIREQRGAISLNRLRRLAAAMDCEVVYAIRPRARKKYSELIFETLQEVAQKHPQVKNALSQHRARALAGTAYHYMQRTQFRREQGWSMRKVESER